MSIRPDHIRTQLPPPSRLDRGVPGLLHRGSHRRRVPRRRASWTVRERRLGERLERELAGWAITLHSRLPGTDLECQPIDHIVVGPAGVWVILADHRLGHFTSRAAAASVAERNHDFAQCGAACATVLSSIGFDWLDVQFASCMTNSRGLGRRPLRIGDVWVARPSSLPSLVARPGPMFPLDISTVAAELSRRFPAAH